MIKEVSPTDVSSLVKEGWLFVDVRTPAEWSLLHAKGVVNIPLDKIDQEALKGHFGDSKKFVLICQGGNRSKLACEKLMSLEGIEVVSVQGGTAAWTQAGLDVVRGKGVISLDRQVRIAAGSMVVLGLFLSRYVAYEFVYLTLFVGVGLIFAGVTDFCGLAMLIAKMPWNNAKNLKTNCSI